MTSKQKIYILCRGWFTDFSAHSPVDVDNACKKWEDNGANRSSNILNKVGGLPENYCITVELTYDENDGNALGDFNDTCKKYGVKRDT